MNQAGVGVPQMVLLRGVFNYYILEDYLDSFRGRNSNDSALVYGPSKETIS